MNRKKVKVIAVAEAFGLLDTIKSERRYWVHPLNVEREKTGHFKDFFENIRRYPQTGCVFTGPAKTHSVARPLDISIITFKTISLKIV